MYVIHHAPCKDLPDDLTCPFSDRGGNICVASLSSMAVGPHKRREYCFSENYDTCPMFLSKMMRRR